MILEIVVGCSLIVGMGGIGAAIDRLEVSSKPTLEQQNMAWIMGPPLAQAPPSVDWKSFEALTERVFAQSVDPYAIDGQSLLESFEEGLVEQQTIQKHVEVKDWRCASCKLSNKHRDYQCQHCGNGFRGGGPFMMGVQSMDIIEAARGLEIYEGVVKPDAESTANAIIQLATEAYESGVRGRDIEYIMELAKSTRGHAVYTNNTGKTVKTSMGTRIEPGEAYAVMPGEIVLIGSSSNRATYDAYDQEALTRQVAASMAVPPHNLGTLQQYLIETQDEPLSTRSTKESGPADSVSARPVFSVSQRRYLYKCPKCSAVMRHELTHCSRCNVRIHWD